MGLKALLVKLVQKENKAHREKMEYRVKLDRRVRLANRVFVEKREKKAIKEFRGLRDLLVQRGIWGQLDQQDKAAKLL